MTVESTKGAQPDDFPRPTGPKCASHTRTHEFSWLSSLEWASDSCALGLLKHGLIFIPLQEKSYW